MLRLETQNISVEMIGKEQGFDLKTALSQNGDALKKAIKDLWDNRNTPGAWADWLNAADNTELFDRLDAYAASIKGQFEHFVVAGIGGSALGPLAMLEALLPSYWNERTTEQRKGYPKFYFVDNVDPDKLKELLEVLDAKKTLVNVITKSGGTSETIAGYMLLRDEIEKVVGKDALKKHLVMTTDPQKGLLRDIVNKEGLQSFEVPADIGGRYSVFCPVGLLPAAVLGVPYREMMRGVKEIIPALEHADPAQNMAAQGALIQYEMFKHGKNISILMPYSAKLASVSDWYVQLWAESLGKKVNLQNQVVHTGPTPHKAVGVTDQHSQVQLFNEGPFDKIITFVRVENFHHTLNIPNLYPDNVDINYLGNQTFNKLLQAEGDATRASLTKNQKANVSLIMPKLDAYHFGQLLFFLEVQTAYMGTLLNINTFDQPGVELGKQYTYALMGRPGFENLRDEASGKVLQPTS